MFSLLSVFARGAVDPPVPVTEHDLLRAHQSAVAVERTIRSELGPFWRAQAHAFGLATIGPLVAIFVLESSGQMLLLVVAADMLALVVCDRIRLAMAPVETAHAVSFLREAAHVEETIRAISRPVGWTYRSIDRAEWDLELARSGIWRNAFIVLGVMGAVLVLLFAFDYRPAA